MTYLLRLDVDRIRRNLERASGGPQTEYNALRALARRSVWRQDERWWRADEKALRAFDEGEVLEQLSRG